MPQTRNFGTENQPSYDVVLADVITVTTSPARLVYAGGTLNDDDQGVGQLFLQADAGNGAAIIIGGYSTDAALAGMTTDQGISLAAGAFFPKDIDVTRIDRLQARSVSGSCKLRYFALK